MLNTFTQKIAYNTLIQIVGKIATTVLSLILVGALTRYLGVFGYGEYTTVFVYISFFGILADFGFFNILVREISAHPEKEEEIVSNLLTFRAIFAFAIYALGVIVSFFMPYSATVKTGILFLSIAMFFLTQNSSLVGIFQTHHRMDKAVLSDVAGRALILVLSLWLIKIKSSLELIIFVNVIGNLFNLFLSWLFAGPFIFLKPAFDFDFWKKIFRAAWPLGVTAIFGVIYFKIDSVMLSILKGSQDVGIYGAPYKILEILTLVPSIFMGNVFPLITRYIEQKDDRLRPAVQKSFDFLSIAAFGILFGGLALSNNIIRFIAGDEFVSASTVSFAGQVINAPAVLGILLFAVAASYFANLFSPVVIAAGKQKSLILPAFLATILNVSLNLILIPRWSYLAASVTTVITEVFILWFWARLTYRYLQFFPALKNLLKIIVAGALMAFVLLFLRGLHVLLAVGLGALIYFALLYSFRVINKDLILSLIPKKI